MNLHIAQLPRLLAERRSSAIFGVVIIAMLWAGIAVKYFEDYQSDRREAERTSQNFSMLFEENVLRSIGEIDKALLYLRRSIETRKDTTDFHTIANTTDVLSEIIVQVAIIDAKGIMRASNAGPQPAPPLDLSDREHYKVHVNSAEDKLFISRPVVGRASGQWSVQFTRRFSDKDGGFGGVVVASLNPNHLTRFYDKIDLGSSAAISLIGSDGVVRSSGGNASGLSLGQDLNGTEIMGYIKSGTNATFVSAEAANDGTSLVTIRKVRGQPLWVSVSVNMADIFKASWATLQWLAMAGIVLTLMILVAVDRILQSESRARQQAQQLHLTLEHMSQGIMLVTKDLQIPVINGRCAELLDLPPGVIENPPRFDELLEYQMKSSESGQVLVAASSGASEPGAIDRQIAVSERRMPNGRVIEVRSGHLPDGSFVQTFTDITKRCEAEAHVARLASEDPLTGLPNRRVFSSALEQISHARIGKDASAPDFAVLFLDLDRFKLVNDTLGHRVGDILLQEVAQRLKRVIGPTSVLARLGGDEFSLVVPVVENRSALEDLARSIAAVISEPFEIDGHQVRSTVSIGIAVGPHDGASADDLLMAADLALYAVKASGRGTFEFYRRSMNKELSDRRQIEMGLREAIERNELELHYQPIIDLKRNVVTGFEALARWRHPASGMVPPTVFIPIAEDSGLILPLGEWALMEACRRAVLWPKSIKVAVNLSPVQLSSPNLPDLVMRVLSETGLAPGRLELEITERIFMDDSEHTMSTLHRLKELGVGISLDDFGTGYSSLSYLRSFPFDKIKIDRAFVSDLAEGTEHVVIVQAVVSIARALGMTTTAEGVETADQQQFLKALSCDEVQGYLFSPPVPIEQVPDVIATWSVDNVAEPQPRKVAGLFG
jgi:diguanylate cyclase (GGDEF)-like protein